MFLFTDAFFTAPGFLVEPFFASSANHRACGTAAAGTSKQKWIIYNFVFYRTGLWAQYRPGRKHGKNCRLIDNVLSRVSAIPDLCILNPWFSELPWNCNANQPNYIKFDFSNKKLAIRAMFTCSVRLSICFGAAKICTRINLEYGRRVFDVITKQHRCKLFFSRLYVVWFVAICIENGAIFVVNSIWNNRK